MRDILSATYLDKSNISAIFCLYLEYLKCYKSGQKKDLSTVENLSKLLVLLLHLERTLSPETNTLLQTAIDHFDELLELLAPEPALELHLQNPHEKRRLGHHRLHILKLLTHCIAIRNKKFCMKVSVSDFGATVAALYAAYPNNDRMAAEGQKLYSTILATNERVLVENVCADKHIIKVLQSLLSPAKANKLTILKMVRLFDLGSEIKMSAVDTREKMDISDAIRKARLEMETSKQLAESMAPLMSLAANEANLAPAQSQVIKLEDRKLSNSWAIEGFLRSLSKNPVFSAVTLEIYQRCEKDLKVYLALEREMNNEAGFRKNTESSVYSNTLIDELDAYGSADSGDQSGSKNVLKLQKSDSNSENAGASPINDFKDMLEDSGDGEDNRYSYNQTRRRKISEDNIRVEALDRNRTGSLNFKLRKKL